MKRAALLSLLAFASPLWSAPIDEAAALLQSKKYPEAAAAFAALPPDESGYAQWLQAVALLHAGKPDEAAVAAGKVPAASPWSRKAGYLKAAALTRAKKHAEAAAIYAEQATRVLRPERRDLLTKALLDLAEEVSSDPPASDIDAPPADFKKARDLYTHALEQELTPALRGEVLFRKAVAEQKLAMHREAAQTLTVYLTDFDPDWSPDGSRAKKGKAGPIGLHRCEARLRLAESQIAIGGNGNARSTTDALLTLLKTAPNLTPEEKALAGDAAWLRVRSFAPPPPPPTPAPAQQQADGNLQQRVQAMQQLDQKALIPQVGQAFSPAQQKGSPAATPVALPFEAVAYLAALREFLQQNPSHKAAPEASQAIGDTLNASGQDGEAIAAYTDFIEGKNFKFDPAGPGHDKSDPATGYTPAEALGRRQQATFFAIGKIHYEKKRYAEAIAQWQKYTVQFPAAPEWASAQSGIIDAEFQLGLQSVAARDEKTARTRFDDFLTKYPLDVRCRQILFIYGQFPYAAALELEENKAPREQSRPLFESAVAEWSRLISKYPDSEEASLALYNSALALSDKLDRLEDGLNAFKRLKWGQWAGPAKERASVMENKSLAVASDRVFRLNETPAVKVSARNIEKLKVSRYPLDVEAFFRSRHRIDAVDLLDIDLIEPEKTWEVPVAGYARYRSVEQSIPIEFAAGQSGACVVRVEGDDWQATTLVLRSDLDAIVESTPREVLAFVVDAAKQQPAAGVSVLVSDGTQIIASGQTGNDGVFRSSVEAIGKSASVNVFVKAANGVSGNFLSREGMQIVKEPTSWSRVLVDRTEYTPGGIVQWLAWRRAVKNGAFSVPPAGEAWKARWQLPDGRLVGEETITWSEFGSSGGSIPLPDTAPAGDYKLTVFNNRETITGSFKVVPAWNVPPLFLTLKFTEGTGITPGGALVVNGAQTIKGSGFIRLWNGPPLPNEKVLLHQPGLDPVEVRSGADGSVPFSFSTTGLKDGQTVSFTVPRFGLTASESFWIHEQFSMRFAGVPEVILPNTETDIPAFVQGWDGRGTEKEVTLTILRRARTGRSRVLEGVPWISDYGQSTADTQMAQVPLKSDAAGRAVHKLKLAEPGDYVLRLDGRTTDGKLIQSSASLRVGGAADDSPLRLLVRTAEMGIAPLPNEVTSVSDDPNPLIVTLGAPLKLHINSRTALPQALVTVHAQDFISHRIMPLAAGNNPLELPVAAAHVPDFRVTVTALDGRKLHGASRAFAVQTRLRLTAEKPVDQLGQRVTVSDLSGKPVQAELRLISYIDGGQIAAPATAPLPLRSGRLSIESSAAFAHPGSSRRRFVETATGLVSYVAADNDQVALVNIQQAELNFNTGNTWLRSNFDTFMAGCSFVHRTGAQRGDLLINSGIWGIKTDAFDVPGSVPSFVDITGAPLRDLPAAKRAEPRDITPHRASLAASAITLSVGSDAQGRAIIPEALLKDRAHLAIMAAAKDSLLTLLTVQLTDAAVPAVIPPAIAPKERFGRVLAGGRFPKGEFTIKLNVPEGATGGGDWPTVYPDVVDGLAQIASMEKAPNLEVRQDNGSALLGMVSALQLARDRKNVSRSDSLPADVRWFLTRVAVSEKDGGWSWGGLQIPPDILTTATTWRALVAANAAGFAVSPELLARVEKLLAARWADIPVNDFEKKAVVLHAQAAAGKADYSNANPLFRVRDTLSETALAHLTAAFIHMGRDTEARELLAVLLKKTVKGNTPDGRETASWPGHTSILQLREGEAVTATALWCLAKLQPEAPEATGAVTWLLNNHAASDDGTTRCRGVVVQALAAWFSTRPEAELKGQDAVEVKRSADHSQIVIRNPGPNPQWISMTRDFTTPIVDRKPWEFPRIASRQYFHASYEKGDISLTSLGSTPVQQAAFGERVRLVIQSNENPATMKHDNVLVIEEYIPGGFMLEEGSIAGNFHHIERNGGRLRFYFGPGTISQITCHLIAVAPGDWQSPATLLMDAYDHTKFRTGEPATIKVLPPGQPSADAYVMNTVEHLELAKILFDRGDSDGCLRELAAVEALKNTAVDSEKDIARMRLWILTARPDGDAGTIVQSFEILTSRHPDLVIPFDKILRVGDAYRRFGEHERAAQVFHAALDGAFLSDSGISAALEDAGDYLGSVDFQEALWREYPDTTQDVVDSLFALAQSLSTRAPDAEKIAVRRGAKKLEKNALLARSRDILQRFMTVYPADANADDAAFSQVNVFFALKDYPGVVTSATAGAAHHPDSSFHNSFLYMAALGHFWQGTFDKALTTAAPVANGDSKDRDYARYITAQVHHAMGKPAAAIEWYQKVKDVYPDAADAVAWFEEKRISLPEITVFKPGDEVKITLDYRNVKEASVQLYKVDLMKLYLREKSLSNITRINLAGIQPQAGETVALGDGKDFGAKQKALTLPVKDEGAYLAIVRGDDLFTSGLVLISALKLEVKESPAEGSVRLNLTDAVKGGAISDAEVKALASSSPEVQSGATDPRGVFEAAGLKGLATVIVRQGTNRYAFHRGTTIIGEPVANAADGGQGTNANAAPVLRNGAVRNRVVLPTDNGKQMKGKVLDKEEYLNNLNDTNRSLQQQQIQNWDVKRRQNNKGVEAKDVFKK